MFMVTTVVFACEKQNVSDDQSDDSGFFSYLQNVCSMSI